MLNSFVVFRLSVRKRFSIFRWEWNCAFTRRDPGIQGRPCDLTSSIKRAVSNFNINSFDSLIEYVLNCSKDHLFNMAKKHKVFNGIYRHVILPPSTLDTLYVVNAPKVYRIKEALIGMNLSAWHSETFYYRKYL